MCKIDFIWTFYKLTNSDFRPLFITIIVDAKSKNNNTDTKYNPNNHLKEKKCKAGTTPKKSSDGNAQINHKKYKGKHQCRVQKKFHICFHQIVNLVAIKVQKIRRFVKVFSATNYGRNGQNACSKSL